MSSSQQSNVKLNENIVDALRLVFNLAEHHKCFTIASDNKLRVDIPKLRILLLPADDPTKKRLAQVDDAELACVEGLVTMGAQRHTYGKLDEARIRMLYSLHDVSARKRNAILAVDAALQAETRAADTARAYHILARNASIRRE